MHEPVAQPDVGEHLSGALVEVARRRSGINRGSATFFKAVDTRQAHCEGLEDGTQFLVATITSSSCRHVAHVALIEHVGALRRRIEAARDAHHRRTPRSPTAP